MSKTVIPTLLIKEGVVHINDTMSSNFKILLSPSSKLMIEMSRINDYPAPFREYTNRISDTI